MHLASCSGQEVQSAASSLAFARAHGEWEIGTAVAGSRGTQEVKRSPRRRGQHKHLRHGKGKGSQGYMGYQRDEAGTSCEVLGSLFSLEPEPGKLQAPASLLNSAYESQQKQDDKLWISLAV